MTYYWIDPYYCSNCDGMHMNSPNLFWIVNSEGKCETTMEVPRKYVDRVLDELHKI